VHSICPAARRERALEEFAGQPHREVGGAGCAVDHATSGEILVVGLVGEPVLHAGQMYDAEVSLGATTAAIVVGTNERLWLPECLATLQRSGGPLVIYVDNASTDGSAGYVRERFPDVVVIERQDNVGYAGANNVGMQAAIQRGARYALLVNPDTRTPTKLVPALTTFMDRNQDYGIVGPLQTEYDDTTDVDTAQPLNAWTRHALHNGERNVFHDDAPRHSSHASPQAGRAAGTLEHAYVQGSALFARLEAVERAGFFDSVYHTYYEETDLCRRVRWHGYRVALLLDASIQHKGGGSAQASRYRSYHMLRNRFLFAYTDPTWTPGELLQLTGAWVGQISLTLVGRRHDPAFAPTPSVVAQVLVSLVRHAPAIVGRRRRNAAVAGRC
jgi:GT2 family glycosyltransferase